MAKLKESKLLGIAVNIGADGGATSVEEIMHGTGIYIEVGGEGKLLLSSL